MAWDARSHEITAKAFGLSGWGSVLPSLPMNAALRARLQTLQLQGLLDTLQFRWSGAEPGLDNFRIAARFTGLGIAASGDQPGIKNLSAKSKAMQRQGILDDSRQLALNLPNLFRDPVMALMTYARKAAGKKRRAGGC